jgi:nucleoside-diphosphate-sugar epimerase
MRVLVTGAAGRLGSQTCHHLVAQGYDVVAADSQYSRGLPVPLKVVDLLDRLAAYALLDGCEAVVHLANHADMGRMSPPQRLYAENVTMNVNVFQAAVEAGVKQIVFSSSIQAISGERDDYNGTGDRPSCLPYLPIDEHTPACPGNLYGVSKASAEELLRHYAFLHPELSCTAIRFPYIFSSLSLRHRRWFPHHGWGRLDEAFAYIAVEDAVELIDRVLQTNRRGYVHFLPASRGNLLGWTPAEVIARFYPNVPLRQPVEQLRALVDIDMLERCYGWTPRHEQDMPRWKG